MYVMYLRFIEFNYKLSNVSDSYFSTITSKLTTEKGEEKNGIKK